MPVAKKAPKKPAAQKKSMKPSSLLTKVKSMSKKDQYKVAAGILGSLAAGVGAYKVNKAVQGRGGYKQVGAQAGSKAKSYVASKKQSVFDRFPFLRGASPSSSAMSP